MSTPLVATPARARDGDISSKLRWSGWLRPSSLLSLLSGAILFGAAITVPADTIVVNDASDSIHECASTGLGACSLRDAITFANGRSGTDSIDFAIETGPQTIRLASALPVITDPLGLRGSTQPGDGLVRIEIDGASTGAGVDGLRTTSGSTSVEGISIYGFSGNAVVISGGGGNFLTGCFLGFDHGGGLVGNGGAGVLISGSAANWVGYPGNLRNAIAGNQDGIRIEGTGADRNILLGNYVGFGYVNGDPFHPPGNLRYGIAVLSGTETIIVDNSVTASGADGLLLGGSSSESLVQYNFLSGNSGNGISLDGSDDNVLGGDDYLTSNWLLRNALYGILLSNGADRNVILSSNIGTDEYRQPLGNLRGGIAIDRQSDGNTIGGRTPLSANAIGSNGGPGVVVLGDSVQNTISGNSIFNNSGLGIDLVGDGPTLNDPCDVDVGPNQLQNAPVLTGASPGIGEVTIRGSLQGRASTTYVIEFFADANGNPSTAPQATTFAGATTVTTAADCGTTFEVTLPVTTSGFHSITATATDPDGSTSELSATLSLPVRFYTIEPCRLMDTRRSADPEDSPSPLYAGALESFQVSGLCGIPYNAQAVSFNFTVTEPTAPGDLRISAERFFVSSPVPMLDYRTGQTRANNAVVGLDAFGKITVFLDQASGTAHLVVDVNGYFQ
ncbi:MAG: right-handed parallel beta-helix repeat-containing protein [Thermoanaerobaculia bacterium]